MTGENEKREEMLKIRLVVINFLSHISVVMLLTYFCTSINNSYTDTRMRMTMTQLVGSIEAAKLQLMNANCGN